MGRLGDKVIATASGLSIDDGEPASWSDLHRIGGEMEDHRLTFEIVLNQREVFRFHSWYVGPDDDADALSILEAARAHRPDAVRSGWLARPHVPWEPVSALPGCTATIDYRRKAERPVIARRTATRIESARLWLESLSAPPEIAITPYELALTEEHLHGRGRTAMGRLPLSALTDHHAYGALRIFVFGRRTWLPILPRNACPLETALDRIVDAQRASALR